MTWCECIFAVVFCEFESEHLLNYALTVHSSIDVHSTCGICTLTSFLFWSTYKEKQVPFLIIQILSKGFEMYFSLLKRNGHCLSWRKHTLAFYIHYANSCWHSAWEEGVKTVFASRYPRTWLWLVCLCGCTTQMSSLYNWILFPYSLSGIDSICTYYIVVSGLPCIWDGMG